MVKSNCFNTHLILSKVKTRTLSLNQFAANILSSNYSPSCVIPISMQEQRKLPYLKIHLTFQLRSIYLIFSWKWLICNEKIYWKGKHQDKNLTKFCKYHPKEEYVQLKLSACSTSVFGSTFLCEKMFSKMKYRNLTADQNICNQFWWSDQ